MFTVCSKCNLRLTVTATDLRAAQGYVRCGRCHNVFNALAALADDPARQGEPEGTATATQSRPALTLPEPPRPAPAAPASVEDLASTDTSLEFNPASTNINEVFIEATLGDSTGNFESIILVGDDSTGADAPADVDAQADPIIAPQMPSASAEPATQVIVEAPPSSEPEVPTTDIADDIDGIIAAPAEDDIPYMSTWSTTTVRTAADGFAANAAITRDIASAVYDAEPATSRVPEDTAPAAVVLDTDRAAAHIPPWAQQGAAAVLILCLLVQALHHYRAALADTALLHRPLTAIYQALGRPLEPRWDIARYEIRQLGATTDGAAPGDLVVRASISNRATRAQPLPLLRVVMQDRFGNRMAARDLQPPEYLGRGAPQVSMMAPGQRVDVQVAFQDPGQAATGFEIDACMAGHAHTVTCANDPGSH